ncbi:uncharacterized protein LOC135834720 isoform X1 [Planococcus citri]|uniref:uncharacterized protein LOC135834720 isoform X1 n=1 Tax=Planococcus citri TaxID=170843 RepID=UPI0031F9C162
MDDEDKWFFDSIKRYNQLQMFDFDKSAQYLDLSSENNLCVALEPDHNNKCEILVCALPSTLQLKEGNNDLKFDRNLSFTHGYFTNSPVVQMKCIPSKEYLVISETNDVGLYNFSCEDSDFIQRISTLPCALHRADVAVNPENNYIGLCESTKDHRLVIDYSNLTTVFNLVDVSEPEANLRPNFLSPDVISFANSSSGSVSLYDIRTRTLSGSISIPDIIEITKSSVSRWVFKSTYGLKSDHPGFNNNLLYLLSTNGNYIVYDWRNLKETAHYSKHQFDCESKISRKWDIKMAISPSNVNRFTVCGFDENVYVCELVDDKIEVMFTHDGHPYSKDEFEQNVTSVCAQWLPFVSPTTLTSCADNTSLHCWQFLTKNKPE